jgi:hypothetical protein
MSDSASSENQFKLYFGKKVEHVKSVHTNGGRDVLLGLGYMGLLGSNISMASLARVPFG